MSSPTPDQVRVVLSDALRQPRSGRASFVEARCGDDRALRRAVLALLDVVKDRTGPGGSDEGTGRGAAASAMDTIAASDVPSDPGAAATTLDALAAQPRQQIGPYKLLQPLGEGGFGEVWLAEQHEPVRRRVAIKIIKLGMDTKQVIARFEVERQALALMDHPNIAKVLDAGSTESGRPYFVMEAIKGVPIVEYCDTQRLGTIERLGLFERVCHAIQHAHQKGIIHRDIKPSNVLVAVHDGQPVPKVIDFGIAKATHAELTTRTLFTGHRQMIGTPAYMSPEQAEMSALDIDTRSDVYALGVLLYELLTGTTPFDSTWLLEAGYAEMMRIIREEEPQRPSTRLSSLGDDATQTASRRRADIRRLGTLLRGDLDWIVMKCLEKDRTRRYETANGLAADIARHLRDEPVSASPPGAAYRVRKFVRRNRGGVAAASAIALVLVLGAAGTSWGMLHARGEADRAERALVQATEMKQLLTEMIRGVDPAVAQTEDTTLLRGILDDAAARLESGEIEDPIVAAELHVLIGDVYRTLGLHHESETHLHHAVTLRESSLGLSAPETLETMIALADVMVSRNRYTESEPVRRAVYERLRSAIGPADPRTLDAASLFANTLNGLGRDEEAEAILIDTLAAKRTNAATSPWSLASTLEALGILYETRGDSASAQTHFREAVAVLDDETYAESDLRMNILSNFSFSLRGAGEHTEAETVLRALVALETKVLGPRAFYTLNDARDLARTVLALDRPGEAVEIMRDVASARLEIAPTDHISCGLDAQVLGIALSAAGDADEARETLLASWDHLAPEASADAYKVATARAMVEVLRALEARGASTVDPAEMQSWADRAAGVGPDG